MKDYQIKFITRVSGFIHFHLNYNFSLEVSDFIGCQFALESDFGQSSLAVNFYNFCGMKCPLVRISVADNFGSKSDKWAHYCSLEQCICDYMLCLQYYKPLSTSFETINSFTSFIKGWYCPEKDYIDKIQSIYNQFKSYKNGN